MGREKIISSRKLVNFRLLNAQVRMLDTASKSLGKSKTAVVEEAISYYLNMLHLQGVI